MNTAIGVEYDSLYLIMQEQYSVKKAILIAHRNWFKNVDICGTFFPSYFDI